MSRLRQAQGERSVTVTDHALVRWLERSGALDTEAIRAALAASLDRAVAAASALDTTEFLILADGLVYVVRDGDLRTVLVDYGRRAHVVALAGRKAEAIPRRVRGAPFG